MIKIERKEGDDLRRWREGGHEIYWKVYGRNKRSLVLDLKSAEGLSQLKKLARHSQIVIENFVPGGLEKMGLAPEVLLAENPALVIARISGWGQTGPYSHKPGFGTLIEAMSGFAHLNGYPDRPPVLPPLALADMIAGVYGAAGVLTALRVAEREGKGQVIDLSLFEPIFSFIASEAAKTRITGVATLRSGNQSTHTAPRNVYATSDGGYVAMSGSMQSMAMRILDTIGRPTSRTTPASPPTRDGSRIATCSTPSSAGSSPGERPMKTSRSSTRLASPSARCARWPTCSIIRTSASAKPSSRSKTAPWAACPCTTSCRD